MGVKRCGKFSEAIISMYSARIKEYVTVYICIGKTAGVWTLYPGGKFRPTRVQNDCGYIHVCRLGLDSETTCTCT